MAYVAAQNEAFYCMFRTEGLDLLPGGHIYFGQSLPLKFIALCDIDWPFILAVQCASLSTNSSYRSYLFIEISSSTL